MVLEQLRNALNDGGRVDASGHGLPHNGFKLCYDLRAAAELLVHLVYVAYCGCYIAVGRRLLLLDGSKFEPGCVHSWIGFSRRLLLLLAFPFPLAAGHRGLGTKDVGRSTICMEQCIS